jgi:hypothetical protein
MNIGNVEIHDGAFVLTVDAFIREPSGPYVHVAEFDRNEPGEAALCEHDVTEPELSRLIGVLTAARDYLRGER